MKKQGMMFVLVLAAMWLGAPIAAWAEEQAGFGVKAASGGDVKEIEKMVQEDPSGFGVQLFRMAGQYCLNVSQHARAVGFYSQALKLAGGQDTGIMEELADANVKAGKAKEAIAIWDTQIMVGGRANDFGNKIRYATFLDKAGQSAKAIQLMQGVIAERPDDVSLYYWIADAYGRQGKNAEMIKELKAIAAKFPAEKAEAERRIGTTKPAEQAPSPVEKAVEQPLAEPVAAAPVEVAAEPAPAEEEEMIFEEVPEPEPAVEAPKETKKKKWGF